MRGLVVAASALSYALMALALGLDFPWYAPFVASLAGLAWVLLHALRPRAPLHGLFFALALVGACFVARGDRTLVGMGIVSLALVGWDLAVMRRLFLRLPRRTEHRWGTRYVLQSAGVSALGFTLGLVGLLVRPRIGFPAALGLSLSIVALLIVALWQSGRFQGEPRPLSVEDDETKGKE